MKNRTRRPRPVRYYRIEVFRLGAWETLDIGGIGGRLENVHQDDREDLLALARAEGRPVRARMQDD